VKRCQRHPRSAPKTPRRG